MKKLVLVGLVLLASVMVLVGCQMEAGAAKVYTFPAAVKVLTDYESPNNTDDTWTYVAFGEWPQSEADISGVDLEEVEGGRGYFKDNYYKDDNDNYYVKHNGSYYKVEPIVWRVLNKDYASTGRALLLAENILIGGIPYYSAYDVKRKIEGVEIFPNNYEHSQIRAFLNGLSYEYKDSDSAEQSKKDEYKGAGFLQTAFTGEALKCIAETTVDNSKESTFGRGETGGDNPYVCTNTSDKIFLLSEQEATTAGYGFVAYNEYGIGNTRIRVTTDYAQATGAYQDSSAGSGGWWWLRSPRYSLENFARRIYNDGNANNLGGVSNMEVGVVPALCIKLQ